MASLESGERAGIHSWTNPIKGCRGVPWNKQRIVRIAQIEGRSTLNKKRITRFAKLTLTAIAALTFAGYAEARNHPKIIVTRPADLPELARKRGQAMLLHATGDGRTHLYIEQNDGARLAVFDVTDPGHVTVEGSAQVDAPGAFDFVSSLGDYAELVRFGSGTVRERRCWTYTK